MQFAYLRLEETDLWPKTVVPAVRLVFIALEGCEPDR